MTLRHLVFIPVWLLTLLILPVLPPTHPWRHQSMSLQSWVNKGTDDAFWFGVIFWVQWLTLVWFAYIAWNK